MDDIGIIDKFTDTFVRYIDTGFGLLEGEVAFLTSIIVGIDIVLAGLFWAWDKNRDVIAGLIKKVLYVGFFALVINNFPLLTAIIFESFAGLGLEAVRSTSLQPDDLMRPGFVAASGFKAAHPLLEEVQNTVGFSNFFAPLALVNAIVLILAWVLVILSFFVISIQLFVAIIEFKLTTLCGYILVPFALWNKSAFLAERVLGAIIAAGIKLMVLAVIIGIGTTLFADFTSAFEGEDVELEGAMVLVLAALSLFGLSIFGPGIAAGLISGAPQLGAGAAIGTVGGLAAGAVAGASVGAAGLRALGSATGAAVKSASRVAGGAAMAYGLGQATSGATGAAGVASGLGGVARATAQAAGQRVKKGAEGARASYHQGQRAAWGATGGASSVARPAGSESGGPDDVPAWARRLQREQNLRSAAQVTSQTIREGDRPGAAANPSLKDEDD